MLALTPVDLDSVAVIGASCGDIAVGVGATLMEIACEKPDLVVHALVLTGAGSEREIEEKNAFITLCTFPQHFSTAVPMRRELATQFRRESASEVHAY